MKTVELSKRQTLEQRRQNDQKEPVKETLFSEQIFTDDLTFK